MTADPGALEIECVETVQRFSALREQWLQLAEAAATASIFTRWDWQFLWWQFYGGRQPLKILVAWAAGQMVGVAPLYVQTQLVAGVIRIRMLRWIGTGGDTAPDDLDPLLHPAFAAQAVARLVDCLLDSVAAWDILMASDLAEDSAFRAALTRGAADRGLLFSESVSANISYAPLPARWTDYLDTLSTKRKSSMRYARKRFESLDGARFFVWEDKGSLDIAIDRLIEMHHLRWENRSDSHAFSSDRYRAFHRELMHACLGAGCLRLYCLQAEGRIIAMYYCYRFRRGIFHFQSGFDPSFAAYSPGVVLLGYALEHAISEGDTVFDMLRGEYEYKSKWGAGSRTTHGVMAHRPGMASIAFRLRRDHLPRLKRLAGRVSSLAFTLLKGGLN